MKQVPFCFSLVVWGNEYVDMLLQVSLRCFLSPKNIPALANRDNSKFVFVTTRSDYQKISNSKIFRILEKYIRVTFLELDMSGDENKYTRMMMGYNLATEFACKEKACAIYLFPDFLVSDGTFLCLEKYAQEGKEVVLLPGPRVIKEKVYEHIDAMEPDESQPLSFVPRELAQLGLNSLHTEFQNYNYEEAHFTKTPQMVSWPIPGDNGLLIRAFHLHPLMVSFVNRKEDIYFDKTDTIDANFIERNFLDINKFVLERDSDNMILYSMTNADDRLESNLLSDERRKLKAIVNISKSTLVNNLHKLYFYNAYKLHSGELGSAWLEVEKKTFSVVAEVYKSYTRKSFEGWNYFRKVLRKILPLRVKNLLKAIYWRLC